MAIHIQTQNYKIQILLNNPLLLLNLSGYQCSRRLITQALGFSLATVYVLCATYLSTIEFSSKLHPFTIILMNVSTVIQAGYALKEIDLNMLLNFIQSIASLCLRYINVPSYNNNQVHDVNI